MQANPLQSRIEALLRASPSGLSEYELIVALLEQEEGMPREADGSSLGLFRKHFLVMNALYRLQAELAQEGLYLSISPLAIRLEPLQDLGLASLPSDEAVAELRDYYLDWANYDRTDATDVEAMLNRFWQRYLAIDKRVEALQALSLPPDASWETVKQAYRRQAATHHPDKGGDPERFRAIREAYEVLLHCYAP